MTATELQDQVVRRLANIGYARYWLDWPSSDGRKYMAVSLLQIDDNNHAHFTECPDLETLGFSPERYCGGTIYVVIRNEESE